MPSWPLLAVVIGVEIALISSAYFAMTSHLAARLGLFVSCMSFALGLQNGAVRQAGGISVHTTYLTGMVTDLLTTATERHASRASLRRESASDRKVNLLFGIWLAFVIGATIGATMVLRFGAVGILGATLLLLVMLIRQWVTRSRQEGR